jgi:hypothetical protein
MTRTVLAIVAATLLAGSAHAEQLPPSGVIADITIACPKDEDFRRYGILLTDDVSAAILFKNDHACVTLQPKTFVKIDRGSMAREFSLVCVRPRGLYDCLWTYAAHVTATQP